MEAISPNTQAILLLTAPLLLGKKTPKVDLLTPSEYKKLARHLLAMQRQPADLLGTDSESLIQACQPDFDPSRLQNLLARGFLLSQALEHWQARSIWVISRADPAYPRCLKARLKEDAPAILYGCGDKQLLDKGDLAVVGSRHIDDGLLAYTQHIGALAARAGKVIVSGGAKGIDQAAIRGVLEAGGKAIGILADSLEKQALHHEHRRWLTEGYLTLVSPYDPNVSFNVGNAMQRNKLIYACARLALVVNAEFQKGGTWAGAIEQLNKWHFVPVYVRATGEPSQGLQALQEKGAQPWPDPTDREALQTLFTSAKQPVSEVNLPLTLTPASAMPTNSPTITEDAGSTLTLSDRLFAKVSELLQELLTTPMKEAEVAQSLGVSQSQAKAWLQRLEAEGRLVRKKTPSGYISKQYSLFS